MQIKDRVFIVTGASSRIGLSTAIALSDRGAKVARLARSVALQEIGAPLGLELNEDQPARSLAVDVEPFKRP